MDATDLRSCWRSYQSGERKGQRKFSSLHLCFWPGRSSEINNVPNRGIWLCIVMFRCQCLLVKTALIDSQISLSWLCTLGVCEKLCCLICEWCSCLQKRTSDHYLGNDTSVKQDRVASQKFFAWLCFQFWNKILSLSKLTSSISLKGSGVLFIWFFLQ